VIDGDAQLSLSVRPPNRLSSPPRGSNNCVYAERAAVDESSFSVPPAGGTLSLWNCQPQRHRSWQVLGPSALERQVCHRSEARMKLLIGSQGQTGDTFTKATLGVGPRLGRLVFEEILRPATEFLSRPAHVAVAANTVVSGRPPSHCHISNLNAITTAISSPAWYCGRSVASVETLVMVIGNTLVSHLVDRLPATCRGMKNRAATPDIVLPQRGSRGNRKR